MIEVTISTAFFIYLCIAMTVIIILWLSSEYKSKTKSTKVEVEETMKCEICLQSFVYDKNKQIVKCPVCNTLNDVKS